MCKLTVVGNEGGSMVRSSSRELLSKIEFPAIGSSRELLSKMELSTIGFRVCSEFRDGGSNIGGSIPTSSVVSEIGIVLSIVILADDRHN